MTRADRAFDGTLARKLDFTGGSGPAGLRLAPRAERLAGPDKYRVLERRRRRAQMAARHLLDLVEDAPSGAER